MAVYLLVDSFYSKFSLVLIFLLVSLHHCLLSLSLVYFSCFKLGWLQSNRRYSIDGGTIAVQPLCFLNCFPGSYPIALPCFFFQWYMITSSLVTFGLACFHRSISLQMYVFEVVTQSFPCRNTSSAICCPVRVFTNPRKSVSSTIFSACVVIVVVIYPM